MHFRLVAKPGLGSYGLWRHIAEVFHLWRSVPCFVQVWDWDHSILANDPLLKLTTNTHQLRLYTDGSITPRMDALM